MQGGHVPVSQSFNPIAMLGLKSKPLVWALNSQLLNITLKSVDRYSILVNHTKHFGFPLNAVSRWICDWFKKADKNRDGRMNFKEVRDLLKMMNVDMNEHHALRLFTVTAHLWPIYFFLLLYNLI